MDCHLPASPMLDLSDNRASSRAALLLLWLILPLACKTPTDGTEPLTPTGDTASAHTANTLQARRHAAAMQVAQAIHGREQQEVASVFANLQVLGGFPAENLVIAMERWSEALGVDCTHCHVDADWAADDVPAKGVARRMVHLSNTINAELQTIEGLASEHPVVNCATCHRGALRPARRVPTDCRGQSTTLLPTSSNGTSR